MNQFVPNGVVLLEIRSSAVAGQPVEVDREFTGVGRQIVWGVGLRSLDHKLGRRHNSGHLIAGDALVKPKVGASQILDRKVSSVHFDSVALQGLAVPLNKHNRVSPMRWIHTRCMIYAYPRPLDHWLLSALGFLRLANHLGALPQFALVEWFRLDGKHGRLSHKYFHGS